MFEDKELEEDLKNKLQKIADDNDALLMSFIAPDTIVRTSPISNDYAKIKIQDLYAIEKIIEDLKDKDILPKKLHLVIHTPGGGVSATTKIAKYLQKTFKKIEAYVPYQAASGGTVLCLAANVIVMGDTSNLTPIDPQIRFHGSMVSTASYEQVIEDMKDKYSTSSPEEIPSPDQQMCNKLDPIIAKEFSKIVLDSLVVALDLLDNSQNPKTAKDNARIARAAIRLTKTVYTHSHQIDAKSASEMGLTISKDADKMALLRVYKGWVSCKLNDKKTNHIIKVFVPKKEENNETENSSTPSGNGTESVTEETTPPAAT